jgi:hypothetical protein
MLPYRHCVLEIRNSSLMTAGGGNVMLIEIPELGR